MILNDFHIRTYGCQELAQLYKPNVTPTWAWKVLRSWIYGNERLLNALRALGFKKGTKTLTPNMVKAIVDSLGEP